MQANYLENKIILRAVYKSDRNDLEKLKKDLDNGEKVITGYTIERKKGDVDVLTIVLDTWDGSAESKKLIKKIKGAISDALIGSSETD